MKRTIIGVCIFSIAMAALEGAVVVYLRALYYPEGFTVAFRLIDEAIIEVELLREISTIVMLLAIGYIAGNTFKDQFAYFILAFAIWDISYYAWLKIFIDWPTSLLEWDILFLIPFTWLSPVLAPLICSVAMIILAFVLLWSYRGVMPVVWLFLIAGSATILYTFLEDYGRLIVENGLLQEYPYLLHNEKFLQAAGAFLPAGFHWNLFGSGMMLLGMAVFIQFRSISKDKAAAITPAKAAVREDTHLG